MCEGAAVAICDQQDTVENARLSMHLIIVGARLGARGGGEGRVRRVDSSSSVRVRGQRGIERSEVGKEAYHRGSELGDAGFDAAAGGWR